MLKSLPDARAEELVAAAADAPTSDPHVDYPSWYLHRWHFLPEGYLSRRSAAGYDHVIRNVYNQLMEGRIIRRAVNEAARLRPHSVVEVGCGPGRLLKALADSGSGATLVGVDLSPYLLERARKRAGTHARLVHADGLELPSEEAAFDLSCASHYIGHLPRGLRDRAFVELCRVVRPGGHILLIDHRWHGARTAEGVKLIDRTRCNAGLIDVSVFERTS